MLGKRIAHLIPEGIMSEALLVALCGVKINPAHDDGYYFTPAMAEHRRWSDNICQKCLAAHEKNE